MGFMEPFSQLVPGAALGLIILARRTAPAMLTSPAPCVMTSAFWSGRRCAVYCSTAFTVCADRPGFALRTRAAAPATTGLAMLVPLRRMYPYPDKVGYVRCR